jgi:hypothetical protein
MAASAFSVRGHGLKAGKPRQVRKEATAACPSLSWFPDGLSFSGLSFSGRCMGDGFLMFRGRASRGALGADEFIVTKSRGNVGRPRTAGGRTRGEAYRNAIAPGNGDCTAESSTTARAGAFPLAERQVADTLFQACGSDARAGAPLPSESKGGNLASLREDDSRNLRDSCFAAARCCFHSWFSLSALR